MSDSMFVPLYTGDIHDDDPFVAGAQLVHTDEPVQSESVAAEPGTGPVAVEPRPTVKAYTEFIGGTVVVPAKAVGAAPLMVMGADRHRVSLSLWTIGAATDTVLLAGHRAPLTAAAPGTNDGTIYAGNATTMLGDDSRSLDAYTGPLFVIGQGAAPVTLTFAAVINNE